MATLELDKDGDVLILHLPAGSVDACFGGADYVLASLLGQIKDIRRRQILQKYADLPVEDLMKADVAAQAELAKQ